MKTKTISKQIHLDCNLTKGEYRAKQQINNANYILDQTGLDIVTCGECGDVNIVDVAKELQECFSCGYTAESCDFPSLFFDGMTVTREVPDLDEIGKAKEDLESFGITTKRSGETLWIVTNGTSLKLSDDEINWRASRYDLNQSNNK